MLGELKGFPPEEFAEAEAWAREGGIALCRATQGIWEGSILVLSYWDDFLDEAQQVLGCHSPIGRFAGCCGMPLLEEVATPQNAELLADFARSVFGR